MGLPKAARWKAVSDKEIASLEKYGVFKLVPIPAGRNGTIPTSQKDYTEAAIQPYGMEGCNSVYTPEVEPELPLNQLEETLLTEVEARCYQAINAAVNVFHTRHPLRRPLRGQPGEGHVQVYESSHEGADAPASLLDQVHRLFHHLQAGRLPACCLLGFQLRQESRQGQVHFIIHCDAGQPSDHL